MLLNFEETLAKWIKIETPSTNQVVEAVDAMDNEEKTCVQLISGEGIVSICGGNDNRVIVFYYDAPKVRTKRSGRLLDESFLMSDEEIDISINGDVNPEALKDTVTKQIAKEVALYYLMHNSLPKGYTWDGEMSDFA